jgi:hypothetical protein
MYRHLVAAADIAVGVLLNADGSDVEFLPLSPRPFPDSTIWALEAQWASRCLHFAGVMAWIDGAVQTQLEPRPDAVAARLNRAFGAYLTVFSTDSKVN